MFFFDFYTVSDSRFSVVEIEIELSDWERAIFKPREPIYLHSQLTFSVNVSSLIPFLYIKTTVAKMAGAVIIKLSLRLYTIWFPNSAKVF